MGDWTKPILTSVYSNFQDELKARDVDAISLTAPSAGIPTGAVRFNRTSKIFEEYDGAVWQAAPMVLALVGGGTGATTAAGARTNLGLGTMAVQAASAVAITGGTIADIDLTFTADGTKQIGSNTYKLGKIYIKNGAVAPVGTDKYLTS